MKPARQTWIDYARGIAIILVLYRHVFEGIKISGIDIGKYLALEHANVLFFSFRMPLFFIVSGIFVMGSLQKRGMHAFIMTKVRTILYPYFLWGAFQITIQLILSNYVNANRSWHSYLQLFYMPRALDQFWYLYALFNVTLVFVLINNTVRLQPVYNILLGILFYYISALAYQHQLILGFVGDILHYYLFLAIGDALSRFFRNKENLQYLQSWKLLAILLLPFLATQYYFLWKNLPYAEMNYEYVEYFQPFLFIGIALTGGAFIIVLSFMLQKWNVIKWLHELGSHSLYIYVAHVMVLAAVRIFMTKVLGIYNVPLLLACGIIMGLAVPVILYKLAVKLNMRWIFTLEDGNIKNSNIKAA